MPSLPDRPLPSHLGAGAHGERANAAAAGLVGRCPGAVDSALPGCRSSSAAAEPTGSPSRASALPSPVSSWAATGALRRAGSRGHVTRANMAAPSGVRLLVRRGKRLRTALRRSARSLTR